MFLKDLLTDIFKTTGHFNYGGMLDYLLMGDNLELFKDMLMGCDEFMDVERFEIIRQPIIPRVIGLPMESEIIKINSGTRFTGNFKIFSISLTPEMFDPNLMYKPVHEGASISPTIYDETTFTPKKTITMTWSPELAQDVRAFQPLENTYRYRQEFHDLLDRILNTPEQYQMKGFRSIMVRGIFTCDQRYPPNEEYVVRL
jgi:hypothetical protein